MTKALPSFRAGDRVAYSAQWLRSTGQQTGEIALARGAIERIVLDVVACVRWDTQAWREELPNKIHIANLAHVGPNLRFCAD